MLLDVSLNFYLWPTGLRERTGFIWCDIKKFYDAQNMPTFFPGLQVTFDLVDPHKDYHVVFLQSQY